MILVFFLVALTMASNKCGCCLSHQHTTLRTPNKNIPFHHRPFIKYCRTFISVIYIITASVFNDENIVLFDKIQQMIPTTVNQKLKEEEEEKEETGVH